MVNAALPAFVNLIAWPAQILLTYMVDIAHMLSRIPHIFVQNLALSWLQYGMLYVLLAVITAVLWFKNKQKAAIITDKKLEIIAGSQV